MGRLRIHNTLEESKEAMRLSGRRWRGRRRDLLAEFKNKPCIRCGNYYHPVAMDFHHRDKNAKDLKYPAWAYVLSDKDLHEEIKKCDVICANCHRILHAEERERCRNMGVMPVVENPVEIT